MDYLDQLGTGLDKQEGMLEEKQKDLAKFAVMSTAAEIGGLAIDYDMLKTQSLFKENQAQQIEIQAQEQANMLRESFNTMLGQETFTATRRGISTQSGSVRASKELSAKNVGEDIATTKASAKSKASALRSQARQDRKAGRNKAISGLISGGSAMYTNIKAL